MIKVQYSEIARPQVFEIANSFADYLLDNRTAAVWKTKGKNLHQHIAGMNPENIDTGVSGQLLLLIALYKKKREEQYLLLINALVSELVQYCREHTTDNYSLYTGRAGAIYVLMEASQLAGQESLLETCLELIRPANGLYLHDVHTTDYLYEGRAGTLLVLYHLYRLTEAAFLKEYVDAYTLKIVSNAHEEKGMVWWQQPGEIRPYPSCSFAYGSAGIRYVLEHLQAAAANDGLAYIIKGCTAFERLCHTTGIRNWWHARDTASALVLDGKMLERYAQSGMNTFIAKDDHSWASGAVGVMLSVTGDSVPLKPQLNDHLFKRDDLFEGASGWGMYCLLHERASLSVITTTLADRLNASSVSDWLNDGLMHGNMGVLYFLVHASGGPAIAENILLPFAAAAPMQKPLKLSFGLLQVRRWLLDHEYPRTLAFMDHIAPSLFAECLSVADLQLFIINTARAALQPAPYERLLDVFSLEEQKIQWRRKEKRSSLELSLNRWSYQESSALQLNMPDEWLQKQQVVVSDSVGLLRTKWDWSFANDLNGISASQQNNLAQPASGFEYIVQYLGEWGVQEMPLKEDTSLLFYLFRRPKPVHLALTEIKGYIQAQPAAVLQALLFSLTGSRNVENFMSRLDRIILERIRQWVYRGIFVIC
ncbi:hypothetical protein HHL17_11665 [Chitinophaga sp. G-6-1-13]|uniref:Lanthionine synthetase C-like protein n=1 Tax=Chitinophaga fulva TaxID=2728842 RepID=A0A848GLI3_9BACT|nr:lanthionine synthetase LanC family protein [Chitinophaga fulva]NML37852.1 hypothetical protein [Chitinophaga fulva]